jgi:hypothetical protein
MSEQNEGVTDSTSERRQQFYNPSFSRGFISETWFGDGKDDAYEQCIDIAWEALLAEDEWFMWLQHHAAAMDKMDNTVWFEDRESLSLKKSPGKSGVNMYVPVGVFGEETSTIELMRAVIVLFYGKAADVLGVDAPPDFGVTREGFG